MCRVCCSPRSDTHTHAHTHTHTHTHTQIKLRHADQEIRLAQDPFPLFPGEILKQIVTQLKVVPANTALRLRAVLDFVEEVGTRRTAGDEWLFEGPGERVMYKNNHLHIIVHYVAQEGEKK